jgi:hypothetical protein
MLTCAPARAITLSCGLGRTITRSDLTDWRAWNLHLLGRHLLAAQNCGICGSLSTKGAGDIRPPNGSIGTFGSPKDRKSDLSEFVNLILKCIIADLHPLFSSSSNSSSSIEAVKNSWFLNLIPLYWSDRLSFIRLKYARSIINVVM